MKRDVQIPDKYGDVFTGDLTVDTFEKEYSEYDGVYAKRGMQRM